MGHRLPALLRFAYAITGNPHDADDLVQEGLERVGVRWASIRMSITEAMATGLLEVGSRIEDPRLPDCRTYTGRLPGIGAGATGER